MNDAPDFVSEAQEIVETFARALLDIEAQNRETKSFDPELLNGAFRAIHTLKGLSSLTGGGPIAQLSHVLENVLDDLRLGKTPMDASALDLLFEVVDIYNRLLTEKAETGGNATDLTQILERLRLFGADSSAANQLAVDMSWIDSSLGTVLTEYEEHRLRENVKLGRTIYRVHASFPFLEIDTGIEAVKSALKAFGEVITYLPSADGSSEDRLDLDILVGSGAQHNVIVDGLANPDLRVEVMWSAKAPAVEAKSAPAAPKPTASPTVATPPVESATRKPGPAAYKPAPPRANQRTEHAEAANDSGDTSVDLDVSLKSISQTVRVDLRRLDGLMTGVGELGVVLSNFSDIYEQMNQIDIPNDIVRGFRDELRNMERRLKGLREGILDVRMVPLGQIFDKLARVVRKIARECGKDIRLGISGADTELDKLIVEELSDPLMHMIRNAIDHGIEMPEEREAKGKQPAGQIDLRAYQKGNRVVIEVVDDGRGMDWREIRDTAVQRGFLLREEAEMLSPRQCINLIFSPGFSTRSKATELSGRGVGMDVVKTNITRLSGTIDIVSEPNRGSCIGITLPVTLALIPALVIESGGETFCIPMNSVLESLMLPPEDIHTVEGHPVVRLPRKTLPLIHVSDIFDLPRRTHTASDERCYVVVVGLAQHRIGLVVDDLLGQREVVIKPLGKALSSVPGIAGATELGANRTVLLLDVSRIVTEALDGYGPTNRSFVKLAQ